MLRSRFRNSSILPGLGGFEHDVGFAGELEKDRAAVGFFNVESDAALVGVEMKKIETLFRMRNVVFERRDTSRLVARRRLDLDHVRAHVGQEFGAMKAKRAGEIEHAIAGQWTASGNVYP